MTDIRYLQNYEKIASPSDRTITVRELIIYLNMFHPDVKVYSTWEGTIKEIIENNIYLSKTGSLYIDADDNFYKEEFEMKQEKE